jgi:hypothetical protein
VTTNYTLPYFGKAKVDWGKTTTPTADKLSNPRAPTTTLPASRLMVPLAQTWNVISSKQPDRGALVPVGGVRQTLPSGDQGGVPRMPAPTLLGLERVPPVKASLGTASAFSTALKKSVNLDRQTKKLAVSVTAPIKKTGLWNAIVGPDRKDPRTGKELIRGFIGQPTKPKSQTGVFARHLVVPRDIVEKSALSRQTRNWIGIPNVPVVRFGVGKAGGDGVKPTPSKFDVTATSVWAPNMGDQVDPQDALRRPAPENELTTGIAGGVDVTQLLFLAGAVFIGFLILKRGV